MSIISQYYANTVKDVLSEEPQPLCHRRLPEPVKIDPQMGLPAEAFDPVKKGWTTFEQRNTRSLFLHSLCSTRKLVALDCVNSIQINLFEAYRSGKKKRVDTTFEQATPEVCSDIPSVPKKVGCFRLCEFYPD